MANFTNPIKAAFGRYLQRFHAMLIADTPGMVEFAGRPFSEAAVWAPGRMIDQVEEMLATWRKNDTSQQARATPFLPVMIAAMSKDYVPAQPDFTRQAADPVDVMIPGDVKERVFKMRAALCELRAQVVVFAQEDSTARSIAMQLQVYASALINRRFYSTYVLAGTDQKWPVQLEMPDVQAISMPNEVKNLTALSVDFNLRASIPLLMFPRTGDQVADGKGTALPGDAPNYADPDGYLVVVESDNASWPDVSPTNPPAGVQPERFTVT